MKTSTIFIHSSMLSVSYRNPLFNSRSFIGTPLIVKLLGLGLRRRDVSIAALQTGSGSASMGYWLMKTEPGEWGWEHQEQNGGVSQWDGVRNALAQIHLRSMRQGDHAFFYHSGKGPAVVGVVEVVKAAYPDVSDDTGKSSMVDVRALAAFPKPVPLSVIKSDEAMHDWILLRQSRLSVMPVTPDVWRRVCTLGELSPPLCQSIEDDDAIAVIKPEKEARPKRSAKEKAEAQGKSAKQKTSVDGSIEIANHEEQSSESGAAPVAELKTYRRKRTVSVETTFVKTYQSRVVKKRATGNAIPS